MKFTNVRELSEKLIEITRAALLNDRVELGEHISIDELVDFAKFHSIENLLYEPLSEMSDSEGLKTIRELFFANVALDTKQLYQFERICACLEENKIRFLPLKGSVMKYIYPDTYKRKSSDIDIFVFEEYEKATELMKGIGFVQTDDDHSVHGSFYNEQVELELHHNIINNKHMWSKACQNIPGRAVPAEGCTYRYDMTLEDYYFYMIAHMAKHMKNGGAGIRFILDVWVFLNKYGDVLDMEKLDSVLKEAGLFEFNTYVIKIKNKWYEGSEETDRITEQIEEYIRNNGWIGTCDSEGKTKALADSKKEISKNRIRGITAVLFPSVEIMKKKYPVLCKAPLLLPVCWVIRGVKVIMGNRELIRQHKAALDYSVDEVVQLQEMFDEIGL